jgi:hypothetical protein
VAGRIVLPTTRVRCLHERDAEDQQQLSISACTKEQGKPSSESTFPACGGSLR